MSVLSRLGVAFKSGFMGDVFDIPFLSSVGPNTTAGERISRETAMTVSAYYACVDLIAGHIAGFPHRVVQDTADGGWQDYPAAPRWCAKPNAEQIWPEFIWQAVCSLLHHGEIIFDTRSRSFAGRPLDLFVLDPVKVQTIRDKQTNALSYTVLLNGHPTPLGPGDIFHVRKDQMPGSDRGLGTLNVLKQTLGINVAARKFQGAFYANGATVSAVLEFSPDIDPAQAQAVLDKFRQDYSGASNAHKIGALKGATYKPIAISQADAQFLESLHFGVEDMARAFHVPTHRLGEGTEKPMFGNSVEQYNINYIQDALTYPVTLLESAFFELLPRPAYLKFDMTGMLRADAAARTELYRALSDLSAIEPDEVRHLEGMNPLTDGRGKFVRMPLNYVVVGPDGPELPAQPDTEAPSIGPESGASPNAD